MKKKILFICPYPKDKAPSQRLKFEQYYPVFELEYEISYSSFISSSFWDIIYKKGFLLKKILYTLKGYLQRIGDLVKIRQYDIIYIHLWVTPFGPPIFEWIFKKLAKKIVYDIDDLVYLNSSKSNSHKVVDLIKGYKKPIYLMKIADHVITCTPYLDKFVRQYNKETTDISSTVDTNVYKPVNSYSNNKKLVIGWSGSLTTSRFFIDLKAVLQKLAKKYDFEVFVMGDPLVEIEGVSLQSVAWTEKDEITNLQSFDIGVYPLPNEEWVLGKSGLKAIQYMALGIPTVATAIGTNYRVIEDGVSGLLVKNNDEWLSALCNLIEQPELRKRLGLAGRKIIEEKFSLEANKHNYLNIFRSLS
jgi:glycosyltransferase involved in cell wall biosynthesis